MGPASDHSTEEGPCQLSNCTPWLSPVEGDDRWQEEGGGNAAQMATVAATRVGSVVGNQGKASPDRP